MSSNNKYATLTTCIQNHELNVELSYRSDFLLFSYQTSFEGKNAINPLTGKKHTFHFCEQICITLDPLQVTPSNQPQIRSHDPDFVDTPVLGPHLRSLLEYATSLVPEVDEQMEDILSAYTRQRELLGLIPPP